MTRRRRRGGECEVLLSSCFSYLLFVKMKGAFKESKGL
jgi:hypothetical protein